MKIKIICYDSSGSYKGIVKNIKNIDSLEYNETVNGGQGSLLLEVNTSFDDMTYLDGDFIEYIIYSDKYKNGFHKYTGIVQGIERRLSITDGEGIVLNVEGVVSLLSKCKINKTYSGTLQQVLDEFIVDFHNQKNIASTMDYLGVSILKNTIVSSDNISVSVDSDMFQALQKIFGKNRKFFINKVGEISLPHTTIQEKVYTLNKNISEININSDGEILIDLIDVEDDIRVGDKVVLQNINKNINLSGKRVEEVAFGTESIRLNIGKVENYKQVLK